MSVLKTVTIAITAITMTTSIASASNFMGLDDLRELNRHRAMAQRLAENSPEFRAKLLKMATGEDNKENEGYEAFAGKGHKVGGKRGVNRLLGIDEKEAKRLRKAAKRQRTA